MAQMSLGLIETIGLTAAIEAADTAVKAANVRLVGYELARGSGMTTVKIEGDVGAVKAAVSAASAAAARVGKIVGAHVIARPAEELSVLICNGDTVGYEIPAAASPKAAQTGAVIAPDAPETKLEDEAPAGLIETQAPQVAPAVELPAKADAAAPTDEEGAKVQPVEKHLDESLAAKPAAVEESQTAPEAGIPGLPVQTQTSAEQALTEPSLPKLTEAEPKATRGVRQAGRKKGAKSSEKAKSKPSGKTE